jgi:hypothetical protein
MVVEFTGLFALLCAGVMAYARLTVGFYGRKGGSGANSSPCSGLFPFSIHSYHGCVRLHSLAFFSVLSRILTFRILSVSNPVEGISASGVHSVGAGSGFSASDAAVKKIVIQKSSDLFRCSWG